MPPLAPQVHHPKSTMTAWLRPDARAGEPSSERKALLAIFRSSHPRHHTHMSAESGRCGRWPNNCGPSWTSWSKSAACWPKVATESEHLEQIDQVGSNRASTWSWNLESSHGRPKRLSTWSRRGYCGIAREIPETPTPLEVTNSYFLSLKF